MQRQNFWAKFHRKFHFSFNNIGIDFDYHGDQITWIYPWKRYANEAPFLSTCYASLFHSLKEYDETEELMKKDLWERSTNEILEEYDEVWKELTDK